MSSSWSKSGQTRRPRPPTPLTGWMRLAALRWKKPPTAFRLAPRANRSALSRNGPAMEPAKQDIRRTPRRAQTRPVGPNPAQPPSPRSAGWSLRPGKQPRPDTLLTARNTTALLWSIHPSNPSIPPASVRRSAQLAGLGAPPPRQPPVHPNSPQQETV